MRLYQVTNAGLYLFAREGSQLQDELAETSPGACGGGLYISWELHHPN
jgi:hypothetical protein